MIPKTYEQIMASLHIGSAVRVGGLSSGVGTVEAVYPDGALIRFTDFPIPNAYYWFELLEIDGIEVAAAKSTASGKD